MLKDKIKLHIKLPFKELLNNRRFTIPFSIAVAFIFWLIIMISQNPNIERTFSDISVNINLENTFVSENKMEIIGDISSQKFAVTVRGPSYVVSSLQSSDFYVYASAAAINAPGEYKLEVSGGKNTNNSEYDFISISPSTVNVKFDYIDTKQYTINAVANGVAAAEGLVAETALVSGTESDIITIKGPRTIINTIDSVVAFAEVNDTLAKSSTFDAEIRVLDANGEQIDAANLILSETSAKVTVPISKSLTVPVIADFTNLPSGFSKESIKYSVDHKQVTVIGTPEAIDKITNVTLTPIDITAISTASNVFNVSAKLPEGVRLLDTIENFTVTVDTSGYTEKVYTVSNMKFKSVASGLTPDQGNSQIRNVKICGPKAVMKKLTADMLYAEVDLADKAAGEHTVKVTVKSDNYNNIWQVGAYSTTVKLK